MRHMKFIVECVLVVSAVGSLAQESARTVQYHSQDIIAIRAKVKYTTLIELPTTEKIMDAATGDKDFWIVDVVGNFCFVHPAKQGISSNLNLITDKGNIYSFTLQDISESTTDAPDLKVIVEPADHSAIVATSGPPQFVPAAQLDQSRQQLAALQSHVEQAVDEYKSAYPTRLKFDYVYKANEAPFDIQSIYHDDKFTYIKTNAPEKFSVYEIKDGKPNLVTYDLREGTYIIKGVLQKNLKTFVYLGAALLVIVAALFSSSGKKTPAQQASTKWQPPQPTLQDNTENNVQELKNQLKAERQKEKQATIPADATGDPVLASATPAAQQAAAATYGPTGIAAPCVLGRPCPQVQQGNMQIQLTPVQQQAQLIAAKERERTDDSRFASNLVYSRSAEQPQQQQQGQMMPAQYGGIDSRHRSDESLGWRCRRTD